MRDSDIQTFFSNGAWAVVDGFSHGLWITVQDQSLARLVAQAFAWKTNAVVVDISQADNYTTNLIDSDVVLDWSLSVPDQGRLEIDQSPQRLAHESQVSPARVPGPIGYHARGRQLINDRPACGLDAYLRKEIFTQMTSLIRLLRCCYPSHAWAGQKEQALQPDQLLNRVLSCYSTELWLDHIHSRVVEMANREMMWHPREAFNLLKFFDRAYD